MHWVELGSPVLKVTLDENLDFVHVGNLWDRARFSIHLICLYTIEILPYPLPDMCRKCHVLVSRTCKKSQFLSSVKPVVSPIQA